MRFFEVPRIVGSGSVQELICQTINLQTAAEEIKEIRKTVIIDNCRVIYDKVIIDGRLRKDIMFKAANAGFPQPGTVQGCGGIVTTIAGTIQDIDVDIAFNALIPVPGACPDDQCVVLEAFVEGEKEEAANIQPTGAFTALIDKSVVFICVKVIRDTVTQLHHEDDRSGWADQSGSDRSGSDSYGLSGGDGAHESESCSGEPEASEYGLSGDPDWKRKQKKHKEKRHKEKKHCGKKHDREPECGDRGHDKLCPKRRSTGIFLGGRIPAPKPGLIPGTWIGPTLIFPGVLNPGIPSPAPLANVIVNPSGTQVQVTDSNSSTH